MNKFESLKQQKLELEKKKIEAENLIKKLDHDIRSKDKEMGLCYQDFFDRKRNQEFVLYKKYPNEEELKSYISYVSTKFPLDVYGMFNALELAEIIKWLYQFQRGKEYDILTIGVSEESGEPVYGGQVFSLVPHLYFFIGNQKTLKLLQEFEGKYSNNERDFFKFYNIYGKDLISIPLDIEYDCDKKLDIECLTGYLHDRNKMINYYNYFSGMQFKVDQCSFSKFKQIFKTNLRHINFDEGYYDSYLGIKDVLNFKMHEADSFLANVLISICIYKKNNGIDVLTSDDYNHIFEVLYGEKVDIIGGAEKDITRKLEYIPSKYERDL